MAAYCFIMDGTKKRLKVCNALELLMTRWLSVHLFCYFNLFIEHQALSFKMQYAFHIMIMLYLLFESTIFHFI
ncbi:hypothetical protein HanIR_Chr14g0699501 [Helianthus annuus]|nr:hypothetical protein HanIR_Chr14g0699501 [Helianthus annuus]